MAPPLKTPKNTPVAHSRPLTAVFGATVQSLHKFQVSCEVVDSEGEVGGYEIVVRWIQAIPESLKSSKWLRMKVKSENHFLEAFNGCECI
jgi:hypothetical protein